ncbi:hypothetical protein [Streptacidiphilus sp. PAMC 29251]
MTVPLTNRRRSARVVRIDPQDAVRAGRLAERDAAYRAALGLADEDPLPGAPAGRGPLAQPATPQPRRP